jgi:hypothetical protein
MRWDSSSKNFFVTLYLLTNVPAKRRASADVEKSFRTTNAALPDIRPIHHHLEK